MSDARLAVVYVALFAWLTCGTFYQLRWYGKKHHRAVVVANLIRDAALCGVFYLSSMARRPLFYTPTLSVLIGLLVLASLYLGKLRREQDKEMEMEKTVVTEGENK